MSADDVYIRALRVKLVELDRKVAHCKRLIRYFWAGIWSKP